MRINPTASSNKPSHDDSLAHTHLCKNNIRIPVNYIRKVILTFIKTIYIINPINTKPSQQQHTSTARIARSLTRCYQYSSKSWYLLSLRVLVTNFILATSRMQEESNSQRSICPYQLSYRTPFQWTHSPSNMYIKSRVSLWGCVWSSILGPQR